MTKTGNGTQVLSGAHTYTGVTTVSGGELRFNGNSIDASGSVNVMNTSTLSGIGVIGGKIIVGPGGILVPGNGSGAGTLTANNGVSFTTGSKWDIRLGGGTPSTTPGGSTEGPLLNPTSNNFMKITGGPADFSGAIFDIEANSANLLPDQPYSFHVASGAGDQSSLNITDPSRFTGQGDHNLSLTGDSNGNVFLNFTPVPEPATLLGITSLASVIVYRWRKLRARKGTVFRANRALGVGRLRKSV
jgi:autotransporter-associated beta strand protein